MDGWRGKRYRATQWLPLAKEQIMLSLWQTRKIKQVLNKNIIPT